MTVASEGMTWASTASTAETRIPPNEDMPIGRSLEIESLRNYILEIMKLDADNKLSLVIEDRINRYALEFANPHTDQFADNILYADPVKGMLARGPELKMEIISEPPDTSLIRVSIRKGKKDIFKDDISINRIDAMRLKKFITENFTADL